MNPYLILGAVLAVLAAATAGYFKGSHDKDQEWTVKTLEQTAKDTQAARDKEKEWGNGKDKIISKQASELAANRALLDTALNGLRDRADRHLPGDTGPACKGATGAELSRPDAVFLARESARADDCRASLTACYSFIDQLRGKKK